MNILFDQGTPVPLRRYLLEHSVTTVYEQGWSNLVSGQLLDAAELADYNLLITTDQNLQYQQNLGKRRIAIIVLRSTSWPRIQNHIAAICAAVEQAALGTYEEIDISFAR